MLDTLRSRTLSFLNFVDFSTPRLHVTTCVVYSHHLCKNALLVLIIHVLPDEGDQSLDDSLELPKTSRSVAGEI